MSAFNRRKCNANTQYVRKWLVEARKKSISHILKWEFSRHEIDFQMMKLLDIKNATEKTTPILQHKRRAIECVIFNNFIAESIEIAADIKIFWTFENWRTCANSPERPIRSNANGKMTVWWIVKFTSHLPQTINFISFLSKQSISISHALTHFASFRFVSFYLIFSFLLKKYEINFLSFRCCFLFARLEFHRFRWKQSKWRSDTSQFGQRRKKMERRHQSWNA